MLLIDKILENEELEAIREFMDGAEFVDGRLTVGELIKHRKDNEQISQTQEGVEQLNQLVIDAFSRNELFRRWVKPVRFSTPIHARYHRGKKYKAHVDAATMGGANPIRTDVSITLFLNDPHDYEGGELAIENNGDMKPVKLAAGSAIIYPTQALHEVREVTAGTRLVTVLWAQSLIRDPHIRRTLFDLSVATQEVTRKEADSDEALLLQKTLHNLERHFIHS